MTQNPPHKLLKEYVRGYCNSLIVATAVKLSLPDFLANKPSTLKYLAHTLKLNRSYLERILNLLKKLEIVDFCPDGKWHLTDIGYHLRKDIPNSFAWETLFLTHPQILSAWGGLDLALRKDTSACKALNNCDLFEYLDHASPDIETFHKGWNQQTKRLIHEILKILDFSKVKHITELGGGFGALLHAILMKYPLLNASFCEKNYMERLVIPNFEADNLQDRVEFIFSDVLETQLPMTDVILAKNFVHLFEDKEVLIYFAHLRSSLNKGGRIILIERLVEPHKDLQDVLYIDIMMLAMTGGKERTFEQFNELMKKSHFSLSKAQPLKEGFFLIEGVMK
jgi:hypothetical protein